MGPQVPSDHVPPAGGVGTLGAPVGLLPRVRPLVGAQVVRAGKDLAADPAGVGLEPRVKPHVPGEHVRAGKRPLTHFALVALDDHSAATRRLRGGRAAGWSGLLLGLLDGLVTRGQMFDQPVVLVEHLAAYLAGESWGGHEAMCSHLAANVQIRRDGEVVREGDAPRENFEPGSARRRRRGHGGPAQRGQLRGWRFQASRGVARGRGSAGRELRTGDGGRARVAPRLVGAV